MTRDRALGQRTVLGIPYWTVDLGRCPRLDHGWAQAAIERLHGDGRDATV